MYGPCDADVSEDKTVPMNYDIKDPFWINSASFKIVFRMVRRILSISPCSTNIERFFSFTGFICTNHRSIFFHTIYMLARLNIWLRTKDSYNHSRKQQKSADTCHHFNYIIIAFQLKIEVQLDNEDNSEEEDDLNYFSI